MKDACKIDQAGGVPSASDVSKKLFTKYDWLLAALSTLVENNLNKDSLKAIVTTANDTP